MFNRLARAAIGPADYGVQPDRPICRRWPPTSCGRRWRSNPGKRYQSAREFARDLAGHFTAGRNELADLMDTLFPELRREAR